MKNGFNASGTQRYRCQSCERKYTPEPKEHGYPNEMRQQALRMYVDGMGLRKIGRHLGIHHKTVMLYAKQLPDADLPGDVRVVEMDELFTFVGEKKTESTP